MLYQIGCLWDDQGNDQEAEKWYRLAVEHNPDWAAAWCSLGDIYNNVGRDDKAEHCYQTAISIAQHLNGATYNLSRVLFDDQNLTPAQKLLERTIEVDPEFSEANFFLAMIYWLEGDSDRAVDQLGRLDKSRDAHLLSSLEYIQQQRRRGTRFFGTTCPALNFAVEQTTIEGQFFEFGVNWGTTIRYIASLTDQEIHGFDSFEGLPQDWETEYQGSYSTYGKMPDVPENVTLHKGWFKDTLPSFFAEFCPSISFVNVDCDLYSSTVEIFDNLDDRITAGQIFVFDEYLGYRNWQNHEFKAFQEYVARTGVAYEYLGFGVFSNQAVIRILGRP